jgi:hypothetical protein
MSVIASETRQSMMPVALDCHVAEAPPMTYLLAILGDKDVHKHSIPNRLTGVHFG